MNTTQIFAAYDDNAIYGFAESAEGARVDAMNWLDHTDEEELESRATKLSVAPMSAELAMSVAHRGGAYVAFDLDDSGVLQLA